MMLTHSRRLQPLALLRHASTNATHARIILPHAQGCLLPLSRMIGAAIHSARTDSQRSAHPPVMPRGLLQAALHRAPGSLYATVSVHSPIFYHHVRCYSQRRGRSPWDHGDSKQRDWLDTVKTGALLAVGAGAVVAAASVGFGFIVFGAAGYGVYTLYRTFFAPYRSAGNANDPFGAVSADIERLFRDRRGATGARAKATSGDASPSRDLDSLLEGLPFMARGLIKTVFSFVGSAMKASMARAGEMRRMTNEYLQANARVMAQVGDHASVSTPQNWMEYTVNGIGRVEAVFPVTGDSAVQAQVTSKASIGSNGQLKLEQLTYRNHRTGEVIDLLQNTPTGPRRKTVVEAEYIDLNDRK